MEASENGTDYHYTHDTEGRVLSKRAWGKTLYENHYDACGRLRELITGEQKTSYGYDKAGRLAEVCASNGIRAQYQYDRNDMQTEVLYGNGLRTSYTYDERSQLTGMETVLPGMSNPLFRGTYAYDANGCRISKTEQIRMDATTPLKVMETSYTYDAMERLTKESLNGAVTSYGYDLAGNRITKSTDGRTESYLYNNRNQLTELHREKDVVRYSYDPAGNLTEENYLTADGASTKKLHYAYDVYNRNVSVTGDDFTQKNHYDAEGFRYAVTENGETTNFVYRNGMPVSELDADKNPVRGYVLGNEYISQVDGTSFGYYLNDEQGSVRYLTGSDGSIRNHYRYSAFGETITAEETVPNRLRYNGQMADGLTGLYYLRARYYNASLGRFTQEDVIYNDGLNLYAYCNSNPVMYSDPSGFAAKSTQPTQESMCKRKNGGEKDSKSSTNSRIALPGDADFVGPINSGSWTLAPNGEGAHLVERSNVRGRASLASFDTTDTPRYYPYGTPESAGQAHIRLHEATRNAGIKLRGGNPNLSDFELIERYKKAYNNSALNGIRGELRLPDSSRIIVADVIPSKAFMALLEWEKNN